MQQTVAGEIEGIDLDRGFLAGMHETDVLVVDHGLDLHGTVGGNDRQKGLGRGDDAADGMDRQLLHRAVDRRRQSLVFCPLLRLGDVLRQPIGLAGCFGQIVQDLPMEFGARLLQLRRRRDNGGLGFR